MKTKEKRYSLIKISIAILLFAIQFGFFYILYSLLDVSTEKISIAVIILEIIAVYFIVNDILDPMYKLAWVSLMIFIPLFGISIYGLSKFDFIKNRVGRSIEKSTKSTHQLLEQDLEVFSRLKIDDDHVARNAQFLRKQRNYPVYQSKNSEYFTLGEYMFSDILKKLNAANDYIFFEFFIMERGIMFDSILEILKRKIEQGVEVKILYDGTNEFKYMDPSYKDELRKMGIQVKVFSPVKPVVSFYQNHRDHRKLIIIDGKVGYTGGINIADEYVNAKVKFGHWKDVGVRIEGEAVNTLTMMFLSLWNWDDEEATDYQRYIIQEKFLHTQGYIIPFGEDPYFDVRVARRMYLNLIQNATKYVHIMTPYLIIDDTLLEELCNSARSGIETIIILPHIPDKKYVFYTSRSYYWQLIEAGVQIYEYTEGFLHAKTIVTDDQNAIVGTINLDYRSLFLHFEDGVYFYKDSVVAKVEEDFLKTQEISQRITLEEYYHFPLWQRIVGRIIRIIAPLM